MTLHADEPQAIIYDVGLVGNGPRGACLNMHAVVTALAEFRTFEQLHTLGKPFKIRFHTFEKKPWSERAVGGAFSPYSHGTINTHFNGPESLAIPSDGWITPKHYRIIHHAADIRGQLEEYIKENVEDLMKEYERVNIAAAALLQQAVKQDGSVDMTNPCCTRGSFGTVLQNQFDEVMDQGSKEIPWMEFHFYYDTIVTECDAISDPMQPTLVTKNTVTNETKTWAFDHVVLCEGNVGKSPVKEALEHRTYLGEVNFDKVFAFFNNLGLIEHGGHLSPNARVLILGMGQSAVDLAVLGVQATGIASLSKHEDSPFKWDNARVEQYAGVFTNLSRGTTYIAPRHTHAAQWPSDTPLPLSRPMVWSTLMDKSGDALSKLLPIVYAAAARALCTTPETNPGRLSNVSDFYDTIFSQNEIYFRSKTKESKGETWPAFLRAGAIYIASGGTSHESHLDWTDEETENIQRVITEHGGWVALRSMPLLHSTQTKLGRASKPGFYHYWKHDMYPYLGASPAPVAHLFAFMFKHNLTTHLSGSFEDLRICPESGKVVYRGKQFDCILGTPVIPIHGNDGMKPLPSHFKETLPSRPMFAKGRLYQTPDGRICGATELGLIGHGVVDNTGEGEPVLREADWNDTHNFSSIIQLSPIVIKYIFCKAALKANGCMDPAASIDSRYRRTWLPEDKYYQLDERFSQAHVELHERAAYVEFCTAYAKGENIKYAEAFAHLMSRSARNTFVSRYRDSAYAQNYLSAIAEIPAFNLRSWDEYHKLWIDYSLEEISQIWQGTCQDIFAGNDL